MSNKTYPKKASGDWHRADIKAALEKAGWTLSALSKEHGYSRRAAGMALSQPWPRLEAIIAKALGVTPQIIWPSRYNPDGTSIVGPRGPRSKKRSRVPRHSDIQARRAA